MNKKKLLTVTGAVNYLYSVFQAIESMDTSSDEDNSDEESLICLLGVFKKNNYEKQKVSRVVLYVEETVMNYTEQQFQQHFRLSRNAYYSLLEKIGPALQRRGAVGRETISIEKQLLSTLWLLATPDSYRSVADRFDMGKSSLSVSFFRVVQALNNIASSIIVWPSGDCLQNIRESFKAIAGLDNVIGAVDGTFICIKAPQQDPEVYVTRKCDYAITLQAVCDSNLKFTDVFVGYPGSVSDSRIFRNSDLFRKVNENVDHFFPNQEFIIGDKAYPILPWCIPPYIDHGRLTRAHKYFNEIHSKTRQTIERSFALLFGRFRRLKFLDMNRHDCIPATVLAACVLHNIGLNYEDLIRDSYIDEGRQMIQNNEEIQNDEVTVHSVEHAKIRRNNICYDLYNN